MAEFMNLIGFFPLWVAVAVLAVFSFCVSWLKVVLARHSWPYPHLKENNEFVGFTYAVFDLIYGVVMAFIIVTAWQRYSQAEYVVMTETILLSELWRDAQGLPKAMGDDIHKDIVLYIDDVINREWQEMSEHGHADTETKKMYEQL